jgi:phospholipid transport system substrate-binding protein
MLCSKNNQKQPDKALLSERLIIMMRILYILLCLLVFNQPLWADDKREVEEIVKRKLDAVFTVLQNKDLDQQTKKNEIDQIVTPMFDFALMAKLTLGKKYWPNLPREKQEKFTELYIELLKTSYLDKLALYTDEKVIFEPPIQAKKKVHIPTELISKDRRTSILYKLYKPADGWKVYDLEIQGVSIIRSYRSQFDNILQSGTIDDLLRKMEKPAGS